MYMMFSFTTLYGDFVSHYKYIFIIALITLAVVVMLKSSVLLLTQIALLLGSILITQINNSILNTLFAIIQIAFSLWVIYKVKKAVDYNYQLVLEKTHAIHREITKTDYTGTRKSF